jgi:hypothetical protein
MSLEGSSGVNVLNVFSSSLMLWQNRFHVSTSNDILSNDVSSTDSSSTNAIGRRMTVHHMAWLV